MKDKRPIVGRQHQDKWLARFFMFGAAIPAVFLFTSCGEPGTRTQTGILNKTDGKRIGTPSKNANADQKIAMDEIRRALEKIAKGEAVAGPLIITYDDVHGLHGGLRLTIRGSGKVEQKVVRQKAGTPKRVTAEEFVKLVRLLIKHEAWEQRVSERNPRPDESRAHVYITHDKAVTHIWEWFNDGEKNSRISEIRALMKEIAWEQTSNKDRPGPDRGTVRKEAAH